MGFTNKYPYVDFHELNADALIAKVDDAVNTVDGYSARLTSAEGSISTLQGEVETPTTGLLDRVTAAESDIDTLEADVNTPSTGLKARMTAAEGDISTLQNEVETPTTGLLDRVTALENQPPGQSGVTEYLKFSSDATPFDYDARITYTYLDDLIATTASADKSVNIILVEDDELGNTWYYTLNAGRYQVSAGTPRGGFAFTCRKPVLDGNNVVVGYNVCTVDVDRNAATPTYTEVYEALPSTATPINITGATNITIISNKSKRVGDTIIIDFSFSTDAIINANDFIVTTQFVAPGNAAPNYFVTQSNVPVSQRMLLNVNGYLSSAESIAQGVTIVVNYRYEV